MMIMIMIIIIIIIITTGLLWVTPLDVLVDVYLLFLSQISKGCIFYDMEIASGTWIVVLLRVALEVTAEWVKSDRLKNKPTYKT